MVRETDTRKATYAIQVACRAWSKYHERGHVKLARAASSHHPARCKVHESKKITKASTPTNPLCSTRATDLCINLALIPLKGSLHGKQNNSTVNMNKNQDLIEEEARSNLPRSKQREDCETNPRRFQSLRD